MGNDIDPTPTTPVEYLVAQKIRLEAELAEKKLDEENKEKWRRSLPLRLFTRYSAEITKSLLDSGCRSVQIGLPNGDKTLVGEVEGAAELLKGHFEKAGWEVNYGWRYPDPNVDDRPKYLDVTLHLPGTRAKYTYRKRVAIVGIVAVLLVSGVIGGIFAYPHLKGKSSAATSASSELSQLIEQGKFDYVNSDINEENFPNLPVRQAGLSTGQAEAGVKTDPPTGQAGFKVYGFDRSMSSEDAIKEMARVGYRPANLRELLVYSQSGWNGKDLVVALGSVGQRWDGRGGVVYLWSDAGERNLRLDWFEGGWSGDVRFLAVRPA
ncbi:MAG: hypothetical protein Q8L24_00225 [bacterium]|nr:hypothetical protein [bacterium]